MVAVLCQVASCALTQERVRFGTEPSGPAERMTCTAGMGCCVLACSTCGRPHRQALSKVSVVWHR